MNIIRIKNNDTDIIDTNYWETILANNGDCYLSIKSWTFRLLVPNVLLTDISRWKNAREVIVSKGPWLERRITNAIEILFDNVCDNPYALHITADQVDQLPLPADQDRSGQPPRWSFAVWTRQGKFLELPGRYRTVKGIPCLKRF